ncbi:MAG TPA: hypothetical protein VFR87_03120 [Nocardioidaceae bacterium]|nr:hypothetical protein [Nocardioidaceae bacterium]
MPTAPSSTEALSFAERHLSDAVRAIRDVRHLVAFRAAAVRGRNRVFAKAGLAVIVLLTVAFGWLPAHLPGAAGAPGGFSQLTAGEIVLILPSAYIGVLVISMISAASSGGGRELLPREQGVAFPVSPTTDHLGALLMAPLNIAWLLQCWTVLAATAFVTGPHNLVAAQVPVLLWLAVATAAAQVVAWLVEWLRRGPAGIWAVRGVFVVAALTLGGLIVTDALVPLLDRSFTLDVALAALQGSEGQWGEWLRTVLLLVLAAVVAVVLGAMAAHALARRPVREETRVETAVQPRRPNPGSDFVALLRVDRAGVWRSVPLRRGFAVLAVLPGLVALASGLEWYMINILPGLVASGGALLFGVNAWTLDGRGALWRESLPASPALVFYTRVAVLLEVLLLAIAIGLLLAMLRAGVPTPAQAVAVVCSSLVVTMQVVAGSMRWSVRRPFAVDMRSARATPAPPLTMVGYSTRLALVTTFTGMLFVGTSRVPVWQLSVLVAVPFLLFSLFRLVRSAVAWEDSDKRSRVVTAVAS